MKKFWKSNNKIIKYILTLFAVWQIVIIVISIISSKFITPRERFIYKDNSITVVNIFFKRANFDGIHYISIAKNGYEQFEQVFFPLYPKLISFLSSIFSNQFLTSGLFISNFCFLILIFALYKLVSIDFNKEVGKKVILMLLLFPVSFFLGNLYTESLFILLIVGSFYFARKRRWLLAGILGAFASYTRIIGIFLFPALLFEWYEQNSLLKTKKSWKDLVSVFLIPVGLISYMRFLSINYQDPLMFFHVKPLYVSESIGNKVVLIYQVFWRYIKMVVTTKMDPLYFSVWQEFLIAVMALILLYIAFKKQIRKSYLIFSLLTFLTPTLVGTFSSTPRYVLSMFPCFIVLGLIKNKLIYRLLLLIFTIFLLISATLFFQGYWVS